MIRVNGAETPYLKDETVHELLTRLDYDPARRGIAVAVDGEVVSRTQWAEVQVGPQATVEIIRAVQGG